MYNTMPVTVLMGCSSTNLSDLIGRLLRTEVPSSMAAIVPKTIGRWKKKKSKSIIPTVERFIDLGEGCSCCKVRSDLLTKIKKLAEKDPVDHLFIQTFPKTDLITLAKTFTVANKDQFVLSQVASLSNMVLIVDASQILKTVYSKTARQLVGQIQFANKVVLTQTSTLSKEGLNHVLAMIEILNPHVDLIQGELEDLEPSSLQSSTPFDLNEAQERFTSVPDPEKIEYTSKAISYLKYFARKPFHPKRLQEFIKEKRKNIIRANGVFWTTSKPNNAHILNVSAGSWDTSEGGQWWAAAPESQRPTDGEMHEYLESIWDPTFADRRQEITFVGLSMDPQELTTSLDQCLLTEDELSNLKL